MIRYKKKGGTCVPFIASNICKSVASTRTGYQKNPKE